MNDISTLLQQLSDSSHEYRSLPFWAWNDALSNDEILFQMEQMHKQGMGGFFIHSREGLETSYLSASWMEYVSYTLKQAQRLGLEAWIYDEDKWPSGSAGGMVAKAGDAYTAKVVSLQYLQGDEGQALDRLLLDNRVLAVYSYNPETQQFSRVHEKPEHWTDLIAARCEMSGPSAWYNGYAPTDMMNPQAVAYFLEHTHQAYERALGSSGIEHVAGFFTDEPNVYDFFTTIPEKRPFLPWTVAFTDEFLKRRGYDILAYLPHLFLTTEAGSSVRFDYWKTVSELFLEAYTLQVSTWCTSRNKQLTGHFLYENDLGYQIRTSGSIMPHYRYLNMPAIDLLGDQRDEYLTVKQCTSVANQFNKKHVLSETYGCTGWDLSFQQQKRLGDWQYVMGVTRRCQHLGLYSISGCRKRDYPPSFNYQSTWWPYLNHLETYFANLSVLATCGQVIRKILVIHPIASLWMESGSSLNEDISRIEMNMGWLDERLVGINKQGSYYNDLAKLLLSHQFDFDFADETILSEDAGIDGLQIKVGLCTYELVVVPPMKTLYSTTAALLSEFADAGGPIVWMEPVPTHLDARINDSVRNLVTHSNSITVTNEGQLIDRLRALVTKPVSIKNRFHQHLDGFLCMSRQFGSTTVHLILNQGSQSYANVLLAFSQKGLLFELDVWNTAHTPLETSIGPEQTMELRTEWAPETLRAFIIDGSKEPISKPYGHWAYHHPHEALHILASMPYRCKVSLDQDNVLVLDACSIEVDDGTYIKNSQVWQAQYELRKHFGFRDNHENGQQQRYTWLPGRRDVHICTFRFSFNVEQPPDQPVFLAVEKPDHYIVHCNNQRSLPTEGYFLDHDIKRFALPELCMGFNEICIEVPYRESTEFEDVYLLGNFSVSPNRTIGNVVTHLDIGSWELQGLKHYPGSVTYEFTCDAVPPKLEQVYLKIRAFKGSFILVSVNDSEPLLLLQDDQSIPIGNHLHSKKSNTIKLKVVGSLVNTLGPLHRSARSCSRISWEDFRTKDTLYTPWHATKPMGILDEVLLYTIPPN